MSLNSMAVVAVMVLMAGCSTSKGAKEANELQRPIVVQTAKDDERPDWTKKTVSKKTGRSISQAAF